MRRAIVGSAALHLGIIGATLVAWSSTRDPNDLPSQVIPVEMVDIADVTNIRPTVREEPKPVEQPEELAMTAPEPTPPELTPPEADEPPPPPPDETVAATVPTPPPPPVRKPPQPPKPNAPDFDAILNRVLADNRPHHAAPPAPAPRAERTMRGIGNMDALTMDIQAAFLQQMRECWNFPAGAPHPEELIVQMDIRLTPDGHLAGTPELSSETRAAMGGNPYMRAAGEAALRAVSICEPYRLPQDKYAAWRELSLTFDPTRMVGR